MIITKSPHGDGSTIVLVALIYFGSSEDANAHFAPIKALGPFAWDEQRVSYAHVNDDFDMLCATGEFKRHIAQGAPRVVADPAVWEAELKAYEAFIEKAGDAGRSMVRLLWAGRGERTWEESGYGHKEVAAWTESVTWYSDEGSAQAASEWQAEALKIAAQGFKEGEVGIFPNSSRDAPIESRYPGEGRLEKLQALKRKWDPEGVFTNVFL